MTTRPHHARGGVLKNAMLVVAAVIVLVIVLLALELYTGVTAQPVITDGPSREVERLSLARQAAFLGEGGNDFDAFAAIILEAQAANQWMFEQWRDADRDEADQDDPWNYASLEHLYVVPDEGTPEQFERARRRACAALDEWERCGVFDRAAGLLDLGPIARPPTNDIMNELMFEWMGATRSLSRALAAHAHVAAEAAEHDAALDAIEQMLVLGRQIVGLGYLIDWLVGLAIQQQAASTLTDVMLLHPGYDDAWLERASELVQREMVDRMPSLSDALAGERLFAADMVQRSFTDNGKGLGKTSGRFLPVQYAELTEGDLFDPPWHLRPLGASKLSNIHGRLYLDRSATDAWLDGAYERHQRAADALAAESAQADAEVRRYADAVTWRNPFAINMFHFGMAHSTERTRRINAAGTLVLLAIERRRLAQNGAPPAALDDLGDLLPPDLRTDPFTQQPWDYAPRAMEADAHGEPLRPGATAWPYTLRGGVLSGYAPDPQNDGGLDPRRGVLITRPVQGPSFDEPAEGEG